MDIEKFLAGAARHAGISGYEESISGYIAEAFRPLADEVATDRLENVIARVGSGNPRIMVAAHHDEIGLFVMKIEKDGSLRMRKIGVDPRILPGLTVTVHTKTGPLFGVIGAKPPHLLTAEDRKSAVKLDDLYIDIGYSAEETRKLVRPGDPVSLNGDVFALGQDVLAGKAMDNRASVLAMLLACEHLRRMRAGASAYFVSCAQEETSSRGALFAANALLPDCAIVVDMTHAEAPGTAKWETFPPEKPTIVRGPNAHPLLQKTAEKVAKENGIPFSVEVCGGVTATDAEVTQIASGGVPTLILSTPARYMHTTVELMRVEALKHTGRLIALVIEQLAREWEKYTWF